MDTCRACKNRLGKPFLTLGNLPLSNAFLPEEALSRMEPYYPLDVYVCNNCYLVQIDEFEKAQDIFSSAYAYFSSYSESWLAHCKKYVGKMMRSCKYGKGSLVIEIASNDGYLLQYFRDAGVSVLGVEPAANTARVAIERGIPTDISYFDVSRAEAMRGAGKQGDLIIGNNVLAHNPDLNGFVEGLRIALKPAGIITMEFPHLLKLIEGNQFDTIYHEHYSYLSLYTVKQLFESHALELFDVEELSTHGGSLRIYAKHRSDTSKPVASAVAGLLQKEKESGMFDQKTYRDFAERVKATKRNLLEFLIREKNNGKRIVGYGAPAKGNTLLNYCGIRTDFIDYTVDRSPHKQSKYLPGTHIPIRHPDAIAEDKPEYVLILPWNIRDEIMEQMKIIREWGGRFIVPVPAVQVL